MIELVLLIIMSVTITGVLVAAVIEAALAADRWAQPRDDDRVASPRPGRNGQVDDVELDRDLNTSMSTTR